MWTISATRLAAWSSICPWCRSHLASWHRRNKAYPTQDEARARRGLVGEGGAPFGMLAVPMDIVTGHLGWIEVICGPMFSGKSEELIRRLRRARIARKRVQVFKPAIDTRYSADEIVSHGDQRMESEVVASVPEILARLSPRTQVIGIDETNF